MTVTKREAAYHELCKLIGISETAGPNRGPMVDKIEAADTLPGNGYSWCQSAQNYAWLKANGELLAGGTASVWAFTKWADERGYRVDRPFKYDHVTYDFGESGGPFDHVGMVEKVLRLGPVMIIRTIEGNTSSGDSGSQSNGGGLYRRTRTVRRSSVRFYRVPGTCPHPERYRLSAADTLRRRTGYYAWLAWYLGEGDWKPYGPKNVAVRPNVPKVIGAAWWARERAFLKARRKKS